MKKGKNDLLIKRIYKSTLDHLKERSLNEEISPHLLNDNSVYFSNEIIRFSRSNSKNFLKDQDEEENEFEKDNNIKFINNHIKHVKSTLKDKKVSNTNLELLNSNKSINKIKIISNEYKKSRKSKFDILPNLKPKLKETPESNNILVRLNVLIKLFQDQNDLISILNTKNQNEFCFSPDTFIYLYEVYKTNLIERIRNLGNSKGQIKKYELSNSKDKEEMIGSSNFNTENEKIIIKEKATSTFLDNFDVKYCNFTNLYGQNSIYSSNIYFKTITENRYLTKAISDKLKIKIYIKFKNEYEKYWNHLDKFVNKECENIDKRKNIYDIHYLKDNKPIFMSSESHGRYSYLKNSIDNFEIKKENDKLVALKYNKQLAQSCYGLVINKHIDEKEIEKKLILENLINTEISKLIKRHNKSIIERQIKKQANFITTQNENFLDNYSDKYMPTINSKDSVFTQRDYLEKSSIPARKIEKKIRQNSDFLHQKLLGVIKNNVPNHLTEYQETEDFNLKMLINIDKLNNKAKEERKLLNKAKSKNIINTNNKKINIYQEGLKNFLKSKN